MADWADYFSNAFTQQNELAQKRAFEKWKFDQENDPQNLIKKNLGLLMMVNPELGASLMGQMNGQGITPPPNMPSGLVAPSNYSSQIPGINPLGGFPPTQYGRGKLMESLGFEQTPESKAAQDIYTANAKEQAKSDIKKTSGADSMASGFDVYLDQYSRSWKEASSMFPDIGEVGVTGKLDRLGGYISQHLDELPETSAMIKMAKPFAQEIATSLEGRATDQDRKIWLDVFPNVIASPSIENTRIASNMLINMQSKLKGTGKDINDVVFSLYKSDVPHIKMMAEQFYQKFPELGAKALESSGDWEVKK